MQPILDREAQRRDTLSENNDAVSPTPYDTPIHNKDPDWSGNDYNSCMVLFCMLTVHGDPE